jgi:CRISPR-associated protein (TIGR03986 family)
MTDADRKAAEAEVRRKYPMLRGTAFEDTVRQHLGQARSSAGTPLRPDHSAEASAPYRFVPYDKNAIAKAQSAVTQRGEHPRPDIADPLPEGLSARIRLAWIAETPLLIGQQADDGAPVTPVRLGGDERAAFMIPAATIRGAIRAVAEIAAAARLTQVNRGRAFSLRDFNHAALRGERSDEGSGGGAFYPIARREEVQAGWLGVRPECRDGFARQARDGLAEGALNDAFQIEPCRWFSIEADDIGAMKDEIAWDWRQLPPRTERPADGKAFTRLPLLVKYGVTGATERGHIAPQRRPYRFRAVGGNQETNRVVPDPAGAIEGYLVFSDRAPAGKRYEYVLGKPTDAPVPLKAEAVLRFRKLNSQAIDDRLKPLASWETALAALMGDPALKIPVFYVGNRTTQPETGTDAFAFGLTRYFKVPHRWSYDEVLAQSGVSVPRGAYKGAELDMVEALFGFVREPGDEDRTLPPSSLALRGRIAFSAALMAAEKGEVGQSIATVMVAPKASFAPFYLAPDAKGYRDYSAPTPPRIAGRKRYPPRHPGAEPAGALPAIAARLQRQIDNVTEVQRGRPPDPKMVTRLCFLLPATDSGLRFESEVRLHNVTKEELGLVLWALTFGGAAGAACRHMLGRAKPFGAGQVRAEVTGVGVRWNARTPPDGFGRGAAKDIAAFLRPFIEAFEAAVRDALPDAKARESWQAAIRALRNTADPAKGAQWERDGKLETMIVARRVDGRTVQYFQRLRDMVKPEFRGHGQPARDPVEVVFLPVE